MTELVDLADNWLGLVRVQLPGQSSTTPRASASTKSLGFEREGTQRASVLRDGKLIDSLMMARLRQPPGP